MADVALCDADQELVSMVRRWAESVWAVWSTHHEVIAQLAEAHLGSVS